MAAVHPPFAASNAMLVLTVGSLACLVGSRAGQLGAWPGGILVPRYTRALFVLCVAGVVLPTVLAGLACWSLGNSAPALAPAMLVGAALVRLAIRYPSAVGIWLWIPMFAIFAGGQYPVVADTASLLSYAWIQLPAVIGAGLIVPGVYRAVARPRIVIDRPVSLRTGLGGSPLEDLRFGALSAASMIGVIVLFWYFFPATAPRMFLVFWVCALGGMIFEWWQSFLHVQLSRSWIFGVALDRSDLGRRTVAGVVWMSLPWLVLGSAWSGIHALVTASAEGFLLKEVLLAQIAMLLSATLLCHLTRRLPPSFFGRTGIFVVLLGLAWGSCTYLALDDHVTSYAALIMALIGAVLLTVFAGGRALARAEILSEGYSPPGRRSGGKTRGRFGRA